MGLEWHWMNERARSSLTRAVVLESGLETFFGHLRLVSDSLVFDSDLSRTQPLDSQNILIISTESNLVFIPGN